METVGEKIKIAVAIRAGRAAMGLGQIEFAEMLGVAKSTVARIETLEVHAKAEFLSKALTLFRQSGLNVDLFQGDKVTIEVSAQALVQAQSRMDTEEMRRTDRKPAKAPKAQTASKTEAVLQAPTGSDKPKTAPKGDAW